MTGKRKKEGREGERRKERKTEIKDDSPWSCWKDSKIWALGMELLEAKGTFNNFDFQLIELSANKTYVQILCFYSPLLQNRYHSNHMNIAIRRYPRQYIASSEYLKWGQDILADMLSCVKMNVAKVLPPCQNYDKKLSRYLKCLKCKMTY